ncbi:MAG: COX15/CtaA family protein [Lentisphaeria bacterium]|nr:COX15/CtaA family protein [Lentisphaeria bacterium]
MKLFLKVIVVTTLLTYSLIFIGGLVRVSGSGLGCPDWPKCHGEWLPPFSAQELAIRLMDETNVDGPSMHDVRLHPIQSVWIEYLNRLAGVLTGFSVMIAAFMSLKFYKKYPKIVLGTWAAFILTCIEGGLGAIVVKTELKPIIVSLHMLGAMIIVSLLVYVAVRAWEKEYQIPADAIRDKQPMQKWIIFTWILSIVQITFGALLRARLQQLRIDLPAATDADLFPLAGTIKWLHIGSGWLTAIICIAIALKLIKAKELYTRAVRGAAWVLVIITILEVMNGIGFKHFGLDPMMQVFHLWFGSMYIGLLFYLYVACQYIPAKHPHEEKSFISFVRFCGFACSLCIIFFTIGTYAVQQAEKGREVPYLLGEEAKVLPFKATERYGHEESEKLFYSGKLTVVNFMFTTCKDICPLSNNVMSELHAEFASYDDVQLVSFSVDPKNDTLESLKKYAGHWGIEDQKWKMLRIEEIPQLRYLAVKSFHVTDDFPENHTGKLILIDGQGTIRDYYEYNNPESLNVLRRHIYQLIRKK